MANPSLQGNFAPVYEEVAVENLTVIGKLPPEIDCLFVRNGPNPQFPPIKNYHWFDGDGMLHGMRIREGKADYRNRYIRTQCWQAENAAGRALYASFLDSPLAIASRTLSNTLQRLPMLKNTANTALVYHNGRLLALWETGEPHEIKLPDLDTAGPYTCSGKLRHPFTAHPKVDTETGELLFFGYDFVRPHISYSIVNATGKLVSTTRIKLARPIMMHDFAITSRYTIFMDLPFTFSVARAMLGQSVVKFEPDLGARFGILPRYGKGQDIRWFDVSTCYVFHTLNAYEDGDDIVLLACRTEGFPDSFFTPADTTARKVIGPEWKPVMYRWRINLRTGSIVEEALDDVVSDFPRINDRFAGRKTRYGYTMTLMNAPNALIKYDYEHGKTEIHVHGKNRVGGEGVFVPRPDATAEDDGWVLTYVHDEATHKSEMVVIESQDFGAQPVARVQIPVRVPYGFHGAYISGEMLTNGF